MGISPKRIADAKILSLISDNLARENLQTLRAQVAQNISHKQQTAKVIYDQNCKAPHKFKVNDLVMVRKTDLGSGSGSKKLMPKFKGPFRVTKILDNDRYIVQDFSSSRPFICTIVVDSLKPWITLSDQDDQPLYVIFDNFNHYEITKKKYTCLGK